MERRFEVRLRELLDEAVVSPEQVRGLLGRLERFVEPFAACLVRSKQRELAQQYVAGLVSQVERKNVESIAYHHDQDRQALQKFVGQYTWDHRPLISELVRQVGSTLGREDAVLVFDPSVQYQISMVKGAALVREALETARSAVDKSKKRKAAMPEIRTASGGSARTASGSAARTAARPAARAKPKVKPAPKATRSTFAPSPIRPEASASSSAMGTEAEDVLPTFSMLK